MLKVVSQPAGVNGSSAAALNTNNAQAAPSEQPQSPRTEASFGDARNYDTTPTRNNTLRRTKLPHRDARELKRTSFPERPEAAVPTNGSINSSPGRRSDKSDRFIDSKVDDAVRGRERLRERDHRGPPLPSKRANALDNLSPSSDAPWNARSATGARSPDITSDSVQGAPQQTPRPSRQRTNGQSNHHQGDAARRTSSRRQDKPAKKRRLSLDYNDAELNAMTYSDLQSQGFDFDPQAAALQQTSVPTGDSIEDKLEHYKDKDSLGQHQFFTQVSIDDWEAAGDWFLEQFSDVVKNMRKVRRVKREITIKFEAEIAAREEAVRGKMEGIDRTLGDLKQEGQTMMKGKDIDV